MSNQGFLGVKRGKTGKNAGVFGIFQGVLGVIFEPSRDLTYLI
jgi:hypothetical protein